MDRKAKVRVMDAQTCEHGERIRRAGFGAKSHKPYAALFCPDGKCEPIWMDLGPIIGQALTDWAMGREPLPEEVMGHAA